MADFNVFCRFLFSFGLLMEGKKEGILHEFNLDATWPSRGGPWCRLKSRVKEVRPSLREM